MKRVYEWHIPSLGRLIADVQLHDPSTLLTYFIEAVTLAGSAEAGEVLKPALPYLFSNPCFQELGKENDEAQGLILTAEMAKRNTLARMRSLCCLGGRTNSPVPDGIIEP